MTDDWQDAVLARLDDAEEIGITSRRPDGSLRPVITIWGVVTDRGLYVRSAYGAGNGWFRRLLASGSGQVSAGGTVADVVPVHPDASEEDAVDDAYRVKYAKYPRIVEGIVGAAHHDVTLRLDPAPRPERLAPSS